MRVIAIASTPAAEVDPADCNEGSGEVPRLDLPLTRRHLLKGTGVLVGSLAAGSVLAALAPSPTWALELKTLKKEEGVALMKLGRTLYPHDRLPDAVYALLAKDLDAAATADAATATLLRDGIAQLDRNSGGPGGFAKATAAKRLAAVKAIEGQPFFAKVRGQCVTSLYDNDMAYAVFGYPGASWEKGGYVSRGFQDLKWLAAPPLEASPKSFLG